MYEECNLPTGSNEGSPSSPSSSDLSTYPPRSLPIATEHYLLLDSLLHRGVGWPYSQLSLQNKLQKITHCQLLFWEVP